ncbi:acetolactate decarboxylase [Nicoliella spurrieriana]|uniref:Alpha-acetolactate decarboxylase n=1 Tax=Nicoliella spurrieriana TaxID=2925830 RepID=A0A976RTE0_9LACO|nr:acetolactate decarboxylase [Nicoliella spurrieriana]UQS87339.1 acetolactate decarboxylase [Nicoliella spurrieriana]
MKDTKTLFQHGTLALLVPGLFDGTIKMDEFMKHGDTGIGTGEGLDGELIVVAGVAYQIDGAGNVNKLDSRFTLPFGNMHFADYQPLKQVDGLDFVNFPENILATGGLANSFFSVKLHGTFKTMQTRSIDKQSKPYHTLAECAGKQHVFDGEDKTGTVIAYYAPQLFNGVAVGGFHSHFLADDLSQGGHILDFTGFSGDVELQVFDNLAQSLPVNDPEFKNHDFSKDDIEGAIKASE